MKPDGVAMEPTEAVGAEPSAQGMATDEIPPQPAPSTSPFSPPQPEDTQNTTAQPENPTAPPASNGANGKTAADPKPKAKTVGLAKPRPGTAGTKTATGPASGPSTSRPGTAPSHMANGLKSSASDLAKKAALDKKKTTAGATKRSVGTAAASTVRTQTKVAVGVPRSTSATRPTNATWSAPTGPGTPTRRPPAAGPINGAGARPKTTASRLAAPKPSSTSAAAKPDRTLVSKTTRYQKQNCKIKTQALTKKQHDKKKKQCGKTQRRYYRRKTAKSCIGQNTIKPGRSYTSTCSRSKMKKLFKIFKKTPSPQENSHSYLSR